METKEFIHRWITLSSDMFYAMFDSVVVRQQRAGVLLQASIEHC